MSDAGLSKLLAGYDHVILDLDGTVWVGDEPTPGAAQAVAALRTAGKGLMFITNEGRHSPEELVRKLWSIGCTAGPGEIVSVGSAMQFVLSGQEPGAGVFVIGSDAIFRHVADAGHRIVNHTPHAERADTVVIAVHDDFDYAELQTATRAVLGGATMLAGGRDANFPTGNGISPGTGAIVAAIEYATGATARNVAKPDPLVFGVALDRLGEGRTLVIGDNLASDLAGAAAAGLPAAIVLSGITDRAAAEAATEPAPVAIGNDLASLVLSP